MIQSWRMVNPAECESLRENWCYSTFPRLLNSDFQNHHHQHPLKLIHDPPTIPEPKPNFRSGTQTEALPWSSVTTTCRESLLRQVNPPAWSTSWYDDYNLVMRMNTHDKNMVINRWQKNPCWDKSTYQHGQHLHYIDHTHQIPAKTSQSNDDYTHVKNMVSYSMAEKYLLRQVNQSAWSTFQYNDYTKVTNMVNLSVSKNCMVCWTGSVTLSPV